MNEQYLNQTIRRLIYLESLKQSEIDRLAPHIKDIDKLIKEKLLDDELTELTIKSFNGIVAEIKQGVQAELIAYTDTVKVTLVDVAADSYAFEAKSIDSAFDGFKLASGIKVAEKAKVLENWSPKRLWLSLVVKVRQLLICLMSLLTMSQINISIISA